MLCETDLVEIPKSVNVDEGALGRKAGHEGAVGVGGGQGDFFARQAAHCCRYIEFPDHHLFRVGAGLADEDWGGQTATTSNDSSNAVPRFAFASTARQGKRTPVKTHLMMKNVVGMLGKAFLKAMHTMRNSADPREGTFRRFGGHSIAPKTTCANTASANP